MGQPGSVLPEPYYSRFAQCIREGAGGQDIFQTQGLQTAPLETPANAGFVRRELERVEAHSRSLCPLLERMVGPVDSIADVGCSTGGSTVAMGLSEGLHPRRVVGVDPNPLSVHAAEIRAAGHGLPASRVSFLKSVPGQPLPLPDDSFDLTVSVSVLEFIPTWAGRCQLVAELQRITRPRGWLFLSTPSPLRLWEYHSGRFLGDYRRVPEHPWSSLPWQLRRLLGDWEWVPLEGYLATRLLQRVGLPAWAMPRVLARAIVRCLPWQKMLVRKPLCDQKGK